MKKLFVILLTVVLAFATMAGCSKNPKPNTSDTPKTEIIVNNWENDAISAISTEKSLTIDEFTAIMDGKTALKQGDLPRDKACYVTERLNQEGYIISDCFTLSCIYADNPTNNLYSLKHFTDGKADGEATNPTDFVKFINSYSNKN